MSRSDPISSPFVPSNGVGGPSGLVNGLASANGHAAPTQPPSESLSDSLTKEADSAAVGSGDQPTGKTHSKNRFAFTGLLAKLTGRRATDEKDFTVAVNPLAVPQAAVGGPAPPSSPLVVKPGASEHPTAAAANGPQSGSVGSNPADTSFVNPLAESIPTKAAASGAKTSAMHTQLPINSTHNPVFAQGKQVESPNALPMPPPSSPHSLSFDDDVRPIRNPAYDSRPNATLQDDFDLDTLLQSDAGSSLSFPPLHEHAAANPLAVGTHSPSPLAAAAVGVRILQDPGDSSHGDSNSLCLSSLPNEWFDTFSDGSYIRDLHNDQLSVDGDRSEDGNASPTTKARTFEAPSAFNSQVPSKRSGTLLDIAARERRHARSSNTSKSSSSRHSASRRTPQPISPGPTVAGAAPSFSTGPIFHEGPFGPTGAGFRHPRRGAKPAGIWDSAHKVHHKQDSEYLTLQRGPNVQSPSGSPQPTRSAGMPLEAEIVNLNGGGAQKVGANHPPSAPSSSTSGNPFSATNTSEFLNSMTQLPDGEAMYEDSDINTTNPLLYDAPIVETCDSGSILSGSTAPGAGVGRSHQKPPPPSGDIFWEAFNTIAHEEQFKPATWPDRVQVQGSSISPSNQSLFGSQGLSSGSFMNSQEIPSGEKSAPSEAGPSWVSTPTGQTHGDARGPSFRAGAAPNWRGSIHDSNSTLPGQRTRIEQKQPGEPKPELLSMRHMV